MPEEVRVTREPMMSSNMARPMMSQGGGSSKLPWIVLAIVVLAVIIGAILFRDKLFSGNENTNTSTNTEQKTSGYQAVFLTNGQVYFGKLSDTAGTYATLRDIYYLQVSTPPLQGTPEQQQAQQQTQQQQRLLLVKLGNELHGPVDEMKINRDQILFYEDIKEDGQVMKSIREYQANPNAGSTGTPQPSATPAANTNR